MNASARMARGRGSSSFSLTCQKSSTDVSSMSAATDRPGARYDEASGLRKFVAIVSLWKGKPPCLKTSCAVWESASLNSGVCCGDGVECAGDAEIHSTNPATGRPLPSVRTASVADYERVVDAGEPRRFKTLADGPATAPRRGRPPDRRGPPRSKADLGLLVTLETGKIRTEGEGEVQEMIDMCDFAVGLSRQLYGLTIASERPSHRMIEQWQPLGPIGIITAFNFPVAVWAWNAMIAAVCGDTMIWKPSPLTPLTAVAVHDIVNDVARANGCEGVFNLCIGGADDIGERMTRGSAAALDLGDGKLPDGPARRRGRRPPAGPRRSSSWGATTPSSSPPAPSSSWRSGPRPSPPSAPPASAVRPPAG